MVVSDDEKDGKIMQWTVKMTKFRDAASVAKIALGLVFASAFQIPMVGYRNSLSLCND